MYRYFISGHSEAFGEDYTDWGIVRGVSYKDACDRVLRYYGAHLEGEAVYDFRIYELEGVLCADELRDMINDSLSKNPF
jgi:hypothetical protein